MYPCRSPHDRYGAAALLGEAIDLGKAEPRSQPDLLCREIGLERPCHHFRGHPAPVSDNVTATKSPTNSPLVGSSISKVTLRAPTWNRPLSGMASRAFIPTLSSAIWNSAKSTNTGYNSPASRLSLRCRAVALVTAYRRSRRRGAASRPARAAASGVAKGEKLTCQALTALGGLRYGDGTPTDCIALRGVVEHRGIAADHCEEIVEVVRDAAGELFDRLHSCAWRNAASACSRSRISIRGAG